ncbi:hypothetical protein MMC18_004033 [Xylographa bjoerkii]|nr:hypothetical protein [Xylographa bjoerkii]
MQPIRCVGLEWELPLIGRGTLVRISPREFASRFFALGTNRQSYIPKDERSILTQAYTKCLDVCLENGPAPGHMNRHDILQKWRTDPYWWKAGRRSGPPTPISPSGSSWDESSRKAGPPKDPAKFDLGRVPDGPRRSSDTYTSREQAMTDYVMPPRDFSSLKDLTLSAFYDRFCNSNPEARKQKPWDVILSAYRDYVCKYYGNDLDHVWTAYKDTNLDVPHNVRWKHCVAMEAEIKQLKSTSSSTSKRSRQSFGEIVSKRVKAEPTIESSEILGISSTIGPGNRRTPSPIFVPQGNPIPAGPSRLYSPTTPHLKVEWMHGPSGIEEGRPTVLPIDIAVKGMAGKSQATNEIPASMSRRSTESSGHVPQVSSVMVRTVVGNLDAGHDRVLRSPVYSTKVGATLEQSESRGQKEVASSPDIVMRKALGGSNLDYDLLQSFIVSENISAVAEQPRIAEEKHAASSVEENNIDSNSMTCEPLSVEGILGAPPPVLGLAVTSSTLPLASEPITAPIIPTVLSGTSTTAKTMSVQATDSIRPSLASVQENSKSLQKSVTKHIVRLEALLKGAITEVEAKDEAITPQSILLEALVQGAALELKALRSAMDIQPAAPEQKMGLRKPVTTHIARLEAFLNGAVKQQETNDDDETTPQGIRLGVLLRSAVAELKVLKAALAA